MKTIIEFINETNQNFLVKGHTKTQLTDLSLDEVYDYIDDIFNKMFKNFTYVKVQTIKNPNKIFKSIKIDEFYSPGLLEIKDIKNNKSIINIKNITLVESEDKTLNIYYNYASDRKVVIYRITEMGIRRQKYTFN